MEQFDTCNCHLAWNIVCIVRINQAHEHKKKLGSIVKILVSSHCTFCGNASSWTVFIGVFLNEILNVWPTFCAINSLRWHKNNIRWSIYGDTENAAVLLLFLPFLFFYKNQVVSANNTINLESAQPHTCSISPLLFSYSAADILFMRSSFSLALSRSFFFFVALGVLFSASFSLLLSLSHSDSSSCSLSFVHVWKKRNGTAHENLVTR